MKTQVSRFILIFIVALGIFSLMFLFIPKEIDLMTKAIIIIFNSFGISIPTLVAMRMQLFQVNKLQNDMHEIKLANNKQKITNYLGLLELEQYIHSDLKKISEYYVGNEASIHSLYRELRDWKDKNKAFDTPVYIITQKFISDYDNLLKLLKELDPHVQRLVLHYVITASKEYLKVISGKGYPSLGANYESDKEIVMLMVNNIRKEWAILYVGFEKALKEGQTELYSKF